MIVGIYRKCISKKSILKIESTTINFDNLVKAKKKLETENILIHEKNYKDLVIYFTRYVHSKLIKILSLYYHELMGKVKIYEVKKFLMIDGYVLNKVLDKIKEIIGIKKFDDTKVLIDTDEKVARQYYFEKML